MPCVCFLKWKAFQKEKNFPFDLFTEASVNLVEIPEMLDAMSDAGFNMVFLGIESPNEDALLMTKRSRTRIKRKMQAAICSVPFARSRTAA